MIEPRTIFAFLRALSEMGVADGVLRAAVDAAGTPVNGERLIGAVLNSGVSERDVVLAVNAAVGRTERYARSGDSGGGPDGGGGGGGAGGAGHEGGAGGGGSIPTIPGGTSSHIGAVLGQRYSGYRKF